MFLSHIDISFSLSLPPLPLSLKFKREKKRDQTEFAQRTLECRHSVDISLPKAE